MQALQHQTGEGPLSANKEVEIRSLKSEIDVLKKQIAGVDSHATFTDILSNFELEAWKSSFKNKHKHSQILTQVQLIFYQNLNLCVCACLLVSDSGQLEKQLEDVSLARRDLEDSSRHIKTLEKQMKSITQERDELHKVQLVFCGNGVLLFLYVNLHDVHTLGSALNVTCKNVVMTSVCQLW